MIRDPFIKLFIAQVLNKRVKDITNEDLLNVKELELNSYDINGNEKLTYFKDILNFPNLEKLTIAHMNINEECSQYLKELKKLKYLELYNSRLCDMSPLTESNSIECLVLTGSIINNIELLNKLTNLQKLVMNNEKLSNLDFFEHSNIKVLSLDRSIIKNYNGLKFLSNLESLSTVGVNIPITFYNNLISIKKIYISYEDYIKNIELIKEINGKHSYKIYLGSIIPLIKTNESGEQEWFAMSMKKNYLLTESFVKVLEEKATDLLDQKAEILSHHQSQNHQQVIIIKQAGIALMM